VNTGSYFKTGDRLFDSSDINTAIDNAKKTKPTPVSTPPETPFMFSRDQARLVANVFSDITKDNGNLTMGEIKTYLDKNPNLKTTNKPTFDAVSYLQTNKNLFNSLDTLDGNADGKVQLGGLMQFAALS
jgi:hypothetical protein